MAEYLSFHLYFNPVEATELGVHDYDGRLPDVSQDGLFSLIAAYHQWLDRVRGLPRDSLAGDAYWDHRILERGIRHRLLELEELRAWERSPLFYVELVTRGLEPLASGSPGTRLERMTAATARLRQVAELLSQARANLLNPPRVATELALESTRGAVRLVRDELPGAFREAPPGEARDRFERTNRQALEELRSFAAWLENDLLPRSQGDFRLGTDAFRRLLLTREHVDVPVADLLSLSRDEVDRYRRWIESEARGFDPTRPPDEVITGLPEGVPSVGELLELAGGRIQEARDFLAREDLLTVPEGPAPVVEPAPAYHAGPPAALATSGPFEGRRALAPRLLLDLPQPGGGDADARARLERLAPPHLLGVAARETYPGRWVQALYLRDVPSQVRKVFRPEALSRGWGLYAEEMALDRGLGGGDPGLRIAQLRSALEAVARLHVSLRMHVEGASVDEGARTLQEMAFMAPPVALREARRLAVEPLAGAAALGKMQISKLRADYQDHLARRGETYVLANFHDRFLRIGTPVGMARKILMPGDEARSLPRLP